MNRLVQLMRLLVNERGLASLQSIGLAATAAVLLTLSVTFVVNSPDVRTAFTNAGKNQEALYEGRGKLPPGMADVQGSASGAPGDPRTAGTLPPGWSRDPKSGDWVGPNGQRIPYSEIRSGGGGGGGADDASSGPWDSLGNMLRSVGSAYSALLPKGEFVKGGAGLVTIWLDDLSQDLSGDLKIALQGGSALIKAGSSIGTALTYLYKAGFVPKELAWEAFSNLSNPIGRFIGGLPGANIVGPLFAKLGGVLMIVGGAIQFATGVRTLRRGDPTERGDGIADIIGGLGTIVLGIGMIVGVATPVGWVVMAIASIAVAGSIIYKNREKIGSFLKNAGSQIEAIGSEAARGIGGFFRGVGHAVGL